MKGVVSFPTLIGISGKMGAGKDTLANRLITFLTRECVRPPAGGVAHLKFAMRLKKVVSLVTGTTVDDNLHHKEKTVALFGNKTLGQLQQEIGTSFRTIYHPNVWVDPVIQDARKHCREGAVSIISDVRFPNEADAIREAGGMVIRLECAAEPLDGRDSAHISETALDDYACFDVVIFNKKDGADNLLEAVLEALAGQSK